MEDKKEQPLRKKDLDVFLEQVKAENKASLAETKAENKASLEQVKAENKASLAEAKAENKANLAQANAKTKEALAKASERTEIALAKSLERTQAALANARAENKRDLYTHSLIITGFILAGLGIFQYFPPQKEQMTPQTQPIHIYTYPPQQEVKGTDQVAQRKPESTHTPQDKDTKAGPKDDAANTDH